MMLSSKFFSFTLPLPMTIERDIKQKHFKNPYNKLTVNLMFTNGWLNNQYAQILKPYHITEPQYNVLKILRALHPNPATINDIIEKMVDKMSNASRLVDKLIAKELVIKKKSSTDLRAVEVRLTENGVHLLEELTSKIKELEEFSFGLDEEEAKNLSLLLERLRKKNI
ncbi:MAG: MarR family transcriptional regulator [Arcicella sp.]|nr:MarR family transcriptional regulator [Arcicella sp.]